MNDKPIGVFDSGIGGLTVVREIIKKLPNEDIIYLGDTARVPYGTRGEKVIRKFSLELTDFLLKQNVKLLVVACNTISSICLDEIGKISSVDVIGVLKPSARRIVETTKSKKVGIIGTNATISSKAYEKEISSLDPEISVTSIVTSLFVPLAEEGLGSSEIARLTSKYYLSNLKGIDTLHLACTHYPLLRKIISETIGENIKIIDSAGPTTDALINKLEEKKLFNHKGGTHRFLFTDVNERLLRISKYFLGIDFRNKIEQVNLST